jgi:hypothetical protein
MTNPNSRRPIATRGSPLVWVFAALTMLALCIYGAPDVVEELKTGRVYSLAVFVGDATKISRSDSPIAFWMNAGLHMAGLVIMIILSILLLCLLVIENRKRVAEQKKKCVKQRLQLTVCNQPEVSYSLRSFLAKI